MKKQFALLTTLLALVSFMMLPMQAEAKNEKRELCLSVHMHCKDCEEKIFNTLRFEKGVLDISTDLKQQQVQLLYNGAKTNPSTLCEALKKIHYEPTILLDTIFIKRKK